MSAADALRERAERHLWLQVNGAPAELRETNRMGMVALARMAREGHGRGRGQDAARCRETEVPAEELS